MIRYRQTPFTVVSRFGAVMVVAILVLGVLNAMPQFLGGDPLGVVRYGSIEQAEARLGEHLDRPAHVPRGWQWPPAAIRFAVGSPDWVAFVLHLEEEGGHAGGGAVTLCQTIGHAPSGADGEVPSALLPPGQLMETGDVAIGGRTVLLRRLLLADGTIVHELWWRDGARRVMLRGRVPADALPRIARTILGSP